MIAVIRAAWIRGNIMWPVWLYSIYFIFSLCIGAHNVGPGKAVQLVHPDKAASILWRWVEEALAVCVDTVVKVWKGVNGLDRCLGPAEF